MDAPPEDALDDEATKAELRRAGSASSSEADTARSVGVSGMAGGGGEALGLPRGCRTSGAIGAAHARACFLLHVKVYLLPRKLDSSTPIHSGLLDSRNCTSLANGAYPTEP